MGRDGAMKTSTFFAAFSLGILASCAQMSPHEAVHSINVRRTVQNARIRTDHDALAKFFEDVAREMETKAAEQKQLLEHYEEKSYLYGREAQDLKSHAAALVRKYHETAEENIKEAAAHRLMAVEQAQHESTGRDGKMAGTAVEKENQGSN